MTDIKQPGQGGMYVTLPSAPHGKKSLERRSSQLREFESRLAWVKKIPGRLMRFSQVGAKLGLESRGRVWTAAQGNRGRGTEGTERPGLGRLWGSTVGGGPSQHLWLCPVKSIVITIYIWAGIHKVSGERNPNMTNMKTVLVVYD